MPLPKKTSTGMWAPDAYDQDDASLVPPAGAGNWDGHTAAIPPPLDPPKPLPGNPGTAGQITVNTEALRTYATNLEALIPVLDQMIAGMDKVNPRAGGAEFTHATELESKTGGRETSGGASSMAERTRGFAVRAKGAIQDLVVEIRNMATLYDRTEDDSRVDAIQMGQYFQTAQAALTALAGAG